MTAASELTFRLGSLRGSKRGIAIIWVSVCVDSSICVTRTSNNHSRSSFASEVDFGGKKFRV